MAYLALLNRKFVLSLRFQQISLIVMDRIPVITKNLLAINVLMFLAKLVAEKNGVDLDGVLGLHFYMSSDFMPYQILTYMFMHGDFAHLFFNMFALYMFGRTLEHIWGPKRFLVFYIVAGVGAGMFQELVEAVRYYSLVQHISPAELAVVAGEGAGLLRQHMNYVSQDLASLNLLLNVSTVGASGAIYAILLGFGMSFPNERLFIFPLPFPIKAKFFVIGYAVIELYLGASGSADGVAHFAHLGGMIIALLLILYWRSKHKIGGPYV